MAVSEDTDHVNWKETYRGLKKKLKILLQENECYQAELRRSQGQLLQATRDRTFLLERLMQYQNVESSGSDSEETDESESEVKPEPAKSSRRKNPEPSNGPSAVVGKKKRSASSSSSRGSTQPANTRNTTRSTVVEKQGGKSTTMTRSTNQRPSIEMSDSSSGFAEGLMNAR